MEACLALVWIHSSCWLLLSMAGGCWGNSKMAWVRDQTEPCGSSSGLTPLTAFFAMFLGSWMHADTDLSRTGGFSWHLMPMCAWGYRDTHFNLTGGLFWNFMPIAIAGGWWYVDWLGDGLHSWSEQSDGTMVVSAETEEIHITDCSWPLLYWVEYWPHCPTLGLLNSVVKSMADHWQRTYGHLMTACLWS